MRGKLIIVHVISKVDRITPAGAGKTSPFALGKSAPQDHPRRCGENISTARRYTRLKGSPPQVRGKLVSLFDARMPARITPAGAGKTLVRWSIVHGTWDHPRRCGENRMSRECRLSALGSPPQVRGKLCRCLGTDSCKGITPAGAGKTVFGTDRRTAAEDHPRRCGEN